MYTRRVVIWKKMSPEKNLFIIAFLGYFKDDFPLLWFYDLHLV